MRVLHCIPSIWSGSGGPSRALVAICRAIALASPSSHIGIATTGYGLTAEWRRHLAEQLPGNVTLRVFPQWGKHTTSVSVGLPVWLWRNCQDFDVVHVHSLLHPMSTLAAGICAIRGVPYVISPHGTLSPYTFAHRNQLPKRIYFSLVERPLIRRAFALTFTTEQEQVKAERLIRGTGSAVIAIPYESEPRQPVERQASTLLFLSRLDPKKGLETLIAAMPAVLQAHPDARLLIAGRGSDLYTTHLHDLVTATGVAGQVEFVGFVEGEAKWILLDTAAIFVLPSFEENFGVAVVEAMAAGMPVVISSDVDLWPAVTRHAAGLVLTSHDVTALAASLIQLLGDPAMRRRMGSAGQRLVREEYALASVGKALVELYTAAAASATVESSTAERS